MSNGAKTFITNGTWADAVLLFARTGGATRSVAAACAFSTATAASARPAPHRRCDAAGRLTPPGGAPP